MALNEEIVPKKELTRLLLRSLDKKVVFAAALAKVSGKQEALLLPRETGTLIEAATMLKQRARTEGIPLVESSVLVGEFARRDDTTVPNVFRVVVGKKVPDALVLALAALLKPTKLLFEVRKRSPRLQHAINVRFLGALSSATERETKENILQEQAKRFSSVLSGSWSIGVEDSDRIEQRLLESTDEAVRILEQRIKEVPFGNNTYTVLSRQLRRLQSYRKRIEGKFGDSLGAVFDDPRVEDIRGVLSLEEAMRAKASGIQFSDIDLESFTDEKLDPENPPEAITKGSFNAPILLTYRNGEKRVFKEELDTFLSGDSVVPASKVGIDTTRPHFGNRNVITSKIAGLLGTETIPKVTFGVHKGKVGILMHFADGVPANKMLEQMPKLNEGQLASLLEQLYELEWADVLAGQMDRHPGNFVLKVDPMSPSVKVTGIDHDLSLGKSETTVDFKKAVTTYPNTDLVGFRTAQRILEIRFDEQLRPAMEGRLAPDEIDAAAQRCLAAQKRVGQLAQARCVVKDWVKWRKEVDGEQLSAARYLLHLKKKPNHRSGAFANWLADAFVKNQTLEDV